MISYELKCDGEIVNVGKLDTATVSPSRKYEEEACGSGVPLFKLVLVLELVPGFKNSRQ